MRPELACVVVVSMWASGCCCSLPTPRSRAPVAPHPAPRAADGGAIPTEAERIAVLRELFALLPLREPRPLYLENGSVGQVGIGLTGVGATNLRATEAENALRGSEPTDEAIAAAARLAAEAAEPQSDNRGTADYKRNVVRVYCERGLRTAISAARAGEE